MRLFVKFLIFFSIVTLTACSTVPGIQEPTDADINADAAKAYAEVKAKSKISDHKAWTQMVDRVARRIAAASDEQLDWEWVLIDSPEVNAWCMPGGKMAVYTGIMPVLKTEAALAAVMGHEVAHATKRHGKQRYVRAIKNQYLGLIVGGAAVLGGEALCKTEQCKMLTQLGGVAAGFAITFFERKFSREDETEADQAGQIYMARAGYDPSEAARLWERMAAASGGKSPPEFMSTHPSEKRRQGDLNTWLVEANAVYANAKIKYGLGENIQ